MKSNIFNKKSTLLVSILSLVLVAVIAVGVTLAWLTQTTNTENNKFTLVTMNPSTPDMNAAVVETFDPTKAVDLKPGSTVEKIVTVKNTSPKDIDEWVAVKLTFQKGDKLTPAVMADLNKVMDLVYKGTKQYNSDDWVRKNTGALQQEEIFYYNTKLVKDASTLALFDTVKILDSANNTDIETVYKWDGFNIKVTGAAVQGDMDTTLSAAVKTELDKLL